MLHNLVLDSRGAASAAAAPDLLAEAWRQIVANIEGGMSVERDVPR
jgi:hypothetical protein